MCSARPTSTSTGPETPETRATVGPATSGLRFKASRPLVFEMCRPDARDDTRRGVSRLDGGADDVSPARFDDIPADERILRPVRALDEHVRLKGADDRVRRVLVEDHGRIDGGQ